MNKFVIGAINFIPLLIFFVIYFRYDQDLMLAIPPFIVATLVALAIVYFLKKKVSMMLLMGGIIITLFGGLALYFDNKIFFYMKPTILFLILAGVLYFGKVFTKKSFFIESYSLSGSPNADIPIKMYSCSFGSKSQRCVIALYHKPKLFGYRLANFFFNLRPPPVHIVSVSHSPIASITIIVASVNGLV